MNYEAHLQKVDMRVKDEAEDLNNQVIEDKVSITKPKHSAPKLNNIISNNTVNNSNNSINKPLKPNLSRMINQIRSNMGDDSRKENVRNNNLNTSSSISKPTVDKNHIQKNANLKNEIESYDNEFDR